METMESLKRRIHTANDLHSVVRTMKALAAVNVRQLEHAVESLAGYKRTVELGLQAVLRQQGNTSITTRTAPQQSLGAIVIGTDQGMCGPLNDQIVAAALEYFAASSIPRDDRAVLAVGGRAAGRLEDAGEPLETSLANASSINGITPLVQDLLLHVDRWHTERRIGRIVVFYCEHVARAGYRPQREELLPMDRDWLARLRQAPWPTHALPIFTLDANLLLSSLVQQYLFVSLYRACAESLASENASRLLAMRGAERNIGDRIEELTRLYHQTRQMAITEELLDIASGFEALADEGERF